MNQKNRFLDNVVPFIVFGIVLVIAISLIILFFYLFLWGVVIGFILWVIMAVKEKFFPSAGSSGSSKVEIFYTERGRVIEGDTESKTDDHSTMHSKKKTSREKK